MPSTGVCKNLLNARHLKDGFGTIDNPERFLNQDYLQSKQYCHRSRMRFIDEMFPPDRQSIGEGLLSPNDLAKVQWLRPKKIVPNPSFVVDGVSRFDFGQGILGNCWFLASAAALTFQDFILKQVIPFDQGFDADYCGLFHFRFWRFGRWVDVIIDDKIPTINGKPIFVHSVDPTEFWPALLEKAYAKVCGSYADMNAGTPSEALVDFTGGVHICVDMSDPPPNLWEMMCRAGQSKSLMGCGTPQGETSANTVLPNGLVQGHAYAITGVTVVTTTQGQKVKLVRLLNPWGQGEWKGAWSDGSPLWQTASAQDREMCLSVKNDGEFWMTLEDFCAFYSDLDICCLCPDFLDGSESCHWKTSYYEGRWVAGNNAGGCMNNTNSFWCNPQYRVEVEKLDGSCAQNQFEKNMLVSLMQKPDKRRRRLVKNLFIGFSIFEVPPQYSKKKGKFSADFFSRNKPVAQTKTYLNGREVMEFVMLKPGEYLIVPSTFNPDETASFNLTILAKGETHVHQHSGGQNHDDMEVEESMPEEKEDDEESRRAFNRQFSDNYEEVNAEKLQKLLNDKILQGQLKYGGFSIDACRSMVALMDTSLTSTLSGGEFVRLWKKVSSYKDIFFNATVSQADTLTVEELRNAIMAAEMRPSEAVLSLVAMRYSNASGRITLESFISLILRLDRMYQIYNQLADGMGVHLREIEWLQLTMYC